MFFNLFFYFILVFYLTDLIIKYSIPLMGNIFKENPNERSSHKKTKLKGGGIFFVFIVLITNLINNS